MGELKKKKKNTLEGQIGEWIYASGKLGSLAAGKAKKRGP